MFRFYLFNVVIYDGVDAYVCKFILPKNEDDDSATVDGYNRVMKYISNAGCEVLKIEAVKPISIYDFKDIVANGTEENEELLAAIDRFNIMYF